MHRHFHPDRADPGFSLAIVGGRGKSPDSAPVRSLEWDNDFAQLVTCGQSMLDSHTCSLGCQDFLWREAFTEQFNEAANVVHVGLICTTHRRRTTDALPHDAVPVLPAVAHTVARDPARHVQAMVNTP